MALSDKQLLIVPNVGQTADPKIVFSGADASTGAQNITLQVYPTNGGTLSFEGSTGQLFSIANTMTGTIFSANDISGIPSIEVLDTGLIKLGQYGGNVVLGSGTDNGIKFQATSTTSNVNGWMWTASLNAAQYPMLCFNATTPNAISRIGNNGDGGLYFFTGATSTTAGNMPLYLSASGVATFSGAVTATNSLTINSVNTTAIKMRYDTTDNYRALIVPYWNSGIDTRLDFAINRASGVTPDVIMSVGYGGNVGIGTTAPTGLLTLGDASAFVMGNRSDLTKPYIGFGSYWNGTDLVAQGASYHAMAIEGTRAFGASNNKIEFSWGGSTGVFNKLMTIRGDGNVGIGTTVPLTTLMVSGSTAAGTYGYAGAAQKWGQIHINSTNAYTTQIGGRISIGGSGGTGYPTTIFGVIEGYKTNAVDNNVGGGLDFWTTNNADGVMYKRMRLEGEGTTNAGSATIYGALSVSTSITLGTLYLNTNELRMNNSGSLYIGYSATGTIYFGTTGGWGNIQSTGWNGAVVGNVTGNCSGTSGWANAVNYLASRTDSAAYPVLWGASSTYAGQTGTYAYSCAAVTIQSNIGALNATRLNATDNTNGWHAQVKITGTGDSGGILTLEGNGATTPNKHIRAYNGNLEVLNSVIGAAITTISDTGKVSLPDNIVFTNGRKGLVGVYDAAQTQAIFAMGSSYVLTDGGASNVIGNFYGIAWSYNPDYGGAGNNPQSKAGLTHQALFMVNGVTTTAIGAGIWTGGAINATGDITAYASDERLKENITPISNAVDKVKAIRGINYNWNDLAGTFGYENKEIQVGVLAQDVQKVLPEIVVPAPFDDNNGISKSGENYLTVKYEKLTPLLIEAIKEQASQIELLQQQVKSLLALVENK